LLGQKGGGTKRLPSMGELVKVDAWGTHAIFRGLQKSMTKNRFCKEVQKGAGGIFSRRVDRDLPREPRGGRKGKREEGFDDFRDTRKVGGEGGGPAGLRDRSACGQVGKGGEGETPRGEVAREERHIAYRGGSNQGPWGDGRHTPKERNLGESVAEGNHDISKVQPRR